MEAPIESYQEDPLESFGDEPITEFLDAAYRFWLHEAQAATDAEDREIAFRQAARVDDARKAYRGEIADLTLTGAELVAEHTGRPVEGGSERSPYGPGVEGPDGSWRPITVDGFPYTTTAPERDEEPEPDAEHEAFCEHHDAGEGR